ncbi:MAG: 3-hydroxyacyl-CoA dehydrogenase family protein [Deltaproteobacteria bacterium]|nr:3-hydroxyacyl-CoA dehydrogenase family protein [Candidatus Anaeroferrophillacea bacterium]
MKDIKTVGVVGFGVMGAAIGLNAAMSGYRVVFKELNDELVATMFAKGVKKPLEKRVAKGKMTQEQMDAVTGMITGTSSYDDLAVCDLVIEAAVEKQDLKIQVFTDVASACPADSIVVSNTSTFPIESLMTGVPSRDRVAGLHYFFPANVNRLVEVIRHPETSDDTYEALMAFARQNRKVPITVRDFPGFAINPVFIASYLILDAFFGDDCNARTLEQVSQDALGVKFGIMWVQNGTGLGTCYHAGASMYDYLAATEIGYPAVPASLKRKFEGGELWDLEGGEISTDAGLRQAVSDRLLGGIFAISTHLVEQRVVSITDLELGITTSLAWPRGPFAMMNEKGMAEVKRLVDVSAAAGDFKLPQKFAENDLTPWPGV